MSDLDHQLASLRSATEQLGASPALKQTLLNTISGGSAAAGFGLGIKLLALGGLTAVAATVMWLSWSGPAVTPIVSAGVPTDGGTPQSPSGARNGVIEMPPRDSPSPHMPLGVPPVTVSPSAAPPTSSLEAVPGLQIVAPIGAALLPFSYSPSEAHAQAPNMLPLCSTSALSAHVQSPKKLAEILRQRNDDGLRRVVDHAREYVTRLRLGKSATLLVLRLRLPIGTKSQDVVAQGIVDESGWFATVVDIPFMPIWFVVPGHEPLSVKMRSPAQGEWFLGEVGFRRLSATTSASLTVDVASPRGQSEVSVWTYACPGQFPNHGLVDSVRPPFLTRRGPVAVFDGLPANAVRIVVREPNAATVEHNVWSLGPGSTRIAVSLETSKKVQVEVLEGRSKTLCNSVSAKQDVAVGEDFALAGLRDVRLIQADGGLAFRSAWRPSRFVGNGPLTTFCNTDPPTPIAFEDRQIQSGDVFRIDNTDLGTAVLMRFEVQ
jgi:hypothetical protein